MLGFARKRRVTMRASVGDHVAGHTYKLNAARADSYILKGYAHGELSRVYTGTEAAGVRAGMQTVIFDG